MSHLEQSPSAQQDVDLASKNNETVRQRKPEDEAASKGVFAKLFNRKGTTGTPKNQDKTKTKKTSDKVRETRSPIVTRNAPSTRSLFIHLIDSSHVSSSHRFLSSSRCY